MVTLAGAGGLVVFAAALFVFALGAVAAFTAGPALKRVLGLFIAETGAALAALALGAPQAFALAGVGVGVAALVIGAALVVRVQERYAAVEIDAVDAADRAAEPAE